MDYIIFAFGITPEYVANNIQRIVDKIHLESPETKIYVQTICQLQMTPH